MPVRPARRPDPILPRAQRLSGRAQAPVRPIAFAVGLGVDGPVSFLSGAPEAFERLAQTERLTLETAGDAVITRATGYKQRGPCRITDTWLNQRTTKSY